MPAGGLAIAGVGALIGGAEALWGNSQKQNYQNQINALYSNRPTYQIPQTEYDINNLAMSQANQGMGAGANQALQNNTDRAISTGANAALMGGGGPNQVAGIVGQAQQGYNQNAIYNDQVRLGNLQNLQTSYARLSADSDKAFQINQLAPWQDKMAALNQQLAGANQFMYQGLGTASSGLMSGIGKAFTSTTPGGGGAAAGGQIGGSAGSNGGGGFSNADISNYLNAGYQ